MPPTTESSGDRQRLFPMSVAATMSSSPAQPEPRAEYLPSLIAMRGLAALLVCIHNHATVGAAFIPAFLAPFVARAYLAVDFFFILSGFTLTHVYHRNFHSLQWSQYRRFLWHRVARIFPLHLAVLAVFLVAELGRLAAQQWGGGFGEPAFGPRRPVFGLVATALLVHSWGLIPPGTNAWNSPSWSISSEWLAYLMAPGIMYLCCERIHGFSIRIVLATLIVVLLRQWVWMHNDQFDIDGLTGTVRCLAGFGLGSLVYPIYAHQRCSWPTWLADGIVGVSLIACTAVMYLSFRPELFLLSAAPLVVALPQSRVGQGILETSPLVWLGKISFSLYLCHYLFVLLWNHVFDRFLTGRPAVLTGIAFGVHLAVVVAASAAAFYWIEWPARGMLRRWETSAP